MAREDRIMRKILLVMVSLLLLQGCVKLTMAWADLTPDRPAATPAILTGQTTLPDWKAQKPQVSDALQRAVYGVLPDDGSTRLVEKRVVDPAYLDGKAVLEEWLVEVTAVYGGTVSDPVSFHMAVMVPQGFDGQRPLILMGTFCPNTSSFPGAGLTPPADSGMCGDGGGLMGTVIPFVFGRYIETAPLEMIAGQGYALASFYPPETVPDYPAGGHAALAGLTAGYSDDETRLGAIGAWGWLFSRAVDVLDEDGRFAPDGTIAWGHSRYGKAALVAAAFDDRIDGVISHQSGAGGASLNKNKLGETVTDITQSYPHWFARTYADRAGSEAEMPVDQHHLLALIAPRPVFLGNARRDVWSDPSGSFLAAQGADPVYELYGSEGLQQPDMKDFLPQADISFFIRPGTHGITEEDWPAFMAFLDAHFPSSAVN